MWQYLHRCTSIVTVVVLAFNAISFSLPSDFYQGMFAPVRQHIILGTGVEAATEKLTTTPPIYLPLITNNATFSSTVPTIGVTTTINPVGGGTLSTGNSASTVSISLTGDRLTSEVTLRYEEVATPTSTDGNLAVVGQAFKLSAETAQRTPANLDISYLVEMISDENEIHPTYSIVTPTAILEYNYDASDVSGLDLRTLFLYQLDQSTNTWKRIPSATFQDENKIISHPQSLGTFVAMADLSARRLPTANNMRLALDPDDNDGSVFLQPYNTKWEEGVFNYRLADEVNQFFINNECHIDILITRDSSEQTGKIANSLRAQMAINFEASMFTTLAFNTLNGTGWGPNGGGMRVWHRSANSNDVALASELTARITEYTGRPGAIWSGSAFYSTFDTLPMVYAHSETLFLDHYTDATVIDSGFSSISGAIYAAIATELADMGLTCGEENLPPALPEPPSAETIQRWRDLGQQHYQKYGADPVSFSTGNFIYQKPLLSINGPNGFGFDYYLFYNAQDNRSDIFGHGWSSPYNVHLQRYNDDSVGVVLSDGRTYHYILDNNNYQPPSGVFAELNRTTDGWKWVTPDGQNFVFYETSTGIGVLDTWSNRKGNTLYFEHDLSAENAWESGEKVPRPPLTQIRDSVGRNIDVTTNSMGYITQFNIFDGRSLSFSYDSNGNLVSITDAAGGTQRFNYDERHRMTHLYDAGNLLYLQNFYDSRDRVIEQIDVDNNYLYINYENVNLAHKEAEPQLNTAIQKTNYINNLGNSEIYYSDEQNRVIAQTNGRGYSEFYTYDNNYNLISSTDRRGFSTFYEYDDIGNKISRTDPIDNYSQAYYSSDIVYWAYNEYNQVISHTNSLGHTWLYEYDSSGNKLKMVDPNNHSTVWKYNQSGQIISTTNARGYTTSYTYDAFGNMTHITDAESHTTITTFDNSGRKSHYTDANGHTSRFSYDNRDNITEIIDPNGNSSFFTYDINGLLIRETDRLGNEISYTYNNQWKLTSTRNPNGYSTHHEYDVLNRRTLTINPQGAQTKYSYDETDNLIEVIDAENNTSYYEYDPSDNQISMIDSIGNKVEKIYDGSNRLKFEIQPNGARTEYCYNSEDQLIRIIGPRNEVTNYYYDGLGQLISIVDPYGKMTSYTYDEVGNRVSMVDKAGHETKYEYDGLNRIVAVYRPFTHNNEQPVDRFTYDAVGNTIAITNPLGFSTSYLYDANDNLSIVTNALDEQTQYLYDQEDRRIQITYANNTQIMLEYDNEGNLVQSTDSLGNSNLYVYNEMGQVVSNTNSLGDTYYTMYDNLGQIISRISPTGIQSQYKRDALGRITKFIDGNGNATSYEYDAVGNLSLIEESLGFTRVYTYDLANNLISQSDQNGNIWKYEYNLSNSLKKSEDPANNTWTYSYDDRGLLIRKVDPNWKATYYSYDSNGQIITKTYTTGPNREISYNYDAAGNQIGMCDSNGCVKYIYDPLNRIVSETDWFGRTITQTYDSVGNRTGIIYPNQGLVSYTYDDANRLIGLEDPYGKTSSFSYDVASQLKTIQYPNNVQSSFKFNADQDLILLDNRLIGSEHPYNTYAYTLDGLGNRTTINETYTPFDLASTVPVEFERKYTFDGSNRVTQFETVFPTSQLSITLDNVGNKLHQQGSTIVSDSSNPIFPIKTVSTDQSFVYNELNQLEYYVDNISSQESTFAYDKRGNRISEIRSTDLGVYHTTQYSYDQEDRLIGFSKFISTAESISATLSITYTLDGYGRRVTKQVAAFYPISYTTTITYLYKSNDLIGLEITDGKLITKTYFYLAQMPNSTYEKPIQIDQFRTRNSEITDSYWYLYDGNGSVSGLTNASGELLESIIYDLNGTPLTPLNEIQYFAYSGAWYEPEGPLYSYHGTLYDPIYGIPLQTSKSSLPLPLSSFATVFLLLTGTFAFQNKKRNKYTNYFLLILLLASPMVLAGCSSGDSNDTPSGREAPKPTPPDTDAPTGESGQHSEPSTGSGAKDNGTESKPAPDDSRYEKIDWIKGEFKITHYTFALESDPIYANDKKVTAKGLKEKYRHGFLYNGVTGILMQGTGLAENGKYIQIDWFNGGPNGENTPFTYGIGGRSGTPIAWKTVATSHPDLPQGSKIIIEYYKERGVFTVNDTGGGVKGAHIDVFVGGVTIEEAYSLGTRSSQVKRVD